MEIAPRGKEGAYIALAVLPYFLGKIGATVMADILTGQYFAEDMVEFPDHEMSWLWIAIMCLLSPLGMLVFKGTFNQSEQMAEEEAQAVMEAEAAEKAQAEAAPEASAAIADASEGAETVQDDSSDANAETVQTTDDDEPTES